MLEPKDQLAIVGMAFRLPGGIHDEEGFWDLLVRGGNTVGRIGPERWDTGGLEHPTRGEPGRSVTFAAGVLDRIEEFDAAFFGISPREARLMDPQQRLVLELAWEALENGGQVPSALAGGDCAVYVGASSADLLLRMADDPSAVEAHTMTGALPSIIANRVSYTLDLRGPSLTVDTACSSSLVALDQACRAIRSGEASAALVGGVNLLLHPLPFVGFSKASMLSQGGRCRTFDGRGDGYVRSEGGVVLFIKPLQRALADGDPIQAVILATGVNSDGRNEGMTLPRPETQADLIRRTVRAAGVDPTDVVYVEAHGTGTAVGDPVETAALGAALGTGRSAGSPLFVGSVKTNLGHLEPASGLAGLVKCVLALKRRTLPPSLPPDAPNPQLHLEERGLRVVERPAPLPDAGKALVMGVSSFGFGGTNAHATLAEFRASASAPLQPDRTPPPRLEGTAPLILSARTDQALRDLAARYVERLAGADDDELYRVAFNAAMRRQRLDQGAAVVGEGVEDVVARLRALASGDDAPGLIRSSRLGDGVPVAFVYSGNGAQWAGMGRLLLDSDPVFAEAVREVDGLVARSAGISILEELRRAPGTDRLHLTEVAQPALFAIQVGITAVLRARGLEPDAVTGHSVGEIAAAWAAGCLTLEQAVEVIVERSAAQGRTAGAGRMAAVGRSADEVRETLAREGLEGQVEVSVVNSPRDVTVSGSLEALDALGRVAEKEGAYFRILDLDYAFHSRHMDGQRERILHRLGHLRPSAGTVPFVSTVTGVAAPGTDLDGAYWWDNIRQPVLFSSAVGHLLERGVRIFVEIGPHAIMQRYLAACLREERIQGAPLPTLQREDDGPDRLTEALWRVHLLGGSVRLDRHFPTEVPYTPLPVYPWQRERHWPDPTNEARGPLHHRKVHPLLGWEAGDHPAVWENHLDPRLLPWLRDHRVGGRTLFPATGFVEMALAASARWRPDARRHEVEGLEIRAPMPLQEDRARTVRFELDREDGTFRIRGRERLSQEPWVLHAVGRLAEPPDGWGEASLALPAHPGDRARVSDADGHYALTRSLGFDFGPAFQGFRGAWREGEGRVLAELDRPAGLGDDADGLILHPALLDASLQAVLHAVAKDVEPLGTEALIPVRVDRILVHRPGVDPRWCRVTVSARSRRSLLMDVDLYDAGGDPVARVEGCRLRATSALSRNGPEPEAWAWTTEVRPLGAEGPSPAPAPGDFAEALARTFASPTSRERRRLRRDEVLPLMEALAGLFALEATRDAFPTSDGPLVPPPALAAHPFTSWLYRTLREDGFLEDRGGLPQIVPPSPPPPPAAQVWTAILGDHPEYLPDLSLLGRMGRQLPRLLRGETSPEELSALLVEEGVWGRYAGGSPGVIEIREALAAALAPRLRAWPAHRRLRILEVGGESLFPALAEALPADRCDFVHVFAGSAPPEALRGQADDGAPGLQLLPAALGADLPQECVAAGPYDVVVVEGLQDLGTEDASLLRQTVAVLAHGGLLILPGRVPDRLSELLGALGAPDRRALPPERLTHLLAEVGLEQVAVALEPDAGSPPSGCYAVLARGPAREARPAPPDRQGERWLVLVRSLGAALARALRTSGRAVVEAVPGSGLRRIGEDRYSFDPLDPSGVEALLAAVHESGGGVAHVVDTLALDACGVAPAPGGDPTVEAEHRVLSALHLVRAVEARLGQDGDDPPRLWYLTRGAATFADPERVSPSALTGAPLWGFGRVLMNEHPELRCTLVDLQDDGPAAAVIPRLLDELLEPDGEDEIILARDGQRRVARLRPVALRPDVAVAPSEVGLELALPGQMRSLTWTARRRRDPDEHEVEIETRAVGLNFRDVMYALGLLSEEAMEGGFAGASLGLEVSGMVRGVGSAVSEFAAGDEVVAFTSGGFAGRVVTPAWAVAKKPGPWSFAAAATVPTTFFTAWYALHTMAGLQRGERVLIHGAAGGVGIAAIQIAHHLGAEIFATAGTEERREILRLLGVRHVMDSRSLAFSDEVLRATDGVGVDVVLNSLAGEAARRNFRVLRPFGRLLELGKRDFYENTRLGLRPLKDNLTYHGIDADQLMLGRPDLARKVLREVMELLEAGVFRPLPYRVFPATQVLGAFRHMQQSRHVGKVVVEIGDAPLRAARAPKRPAGPRFRDDRTYLVAGGVGGLGLRTARWLAEHGARHLLLVSRSGPSAPNAAEAAAAIEAAGARALVRACDIEDREAVSRLMRECGTDLPPLAGVVHSAMVLDDGMILNLDADRTMRVMAPKVRGAWNLHVETLGQPLEHFILFSSASTHIGNPGQANYVAANLFVEALAALRRAEGLPATCVGWGAIRDTGYLTRHEDVRDALRARAGGTGLTADDALTALGALLESGSSCVAVTDFEWDALSRFLSSSGSPRFAPLARRSGTARASGTAGPGVRSLLAEATPEDARAILIRLVTEEVARVLYLPPDGIAPERTLQEIGMDSLTGMELVVALEARLELRLPATALSQHSVSRIVDVLLSFLGREGGADAAPAPPDEGAVALEELQRAAATHGVGYEEALARATVEELHAGRRPAARIP